LSRVLYYVLKIYT